MVQKVRTILQDEATHLVFNPSIAMTKPESIRNKDAQCPFCDRENLEGIISEDGPILLLKNKYPVLQDAFQTVLIETEECQSELSEYTSSHAVRVMEFALSNWKKMRESGDYRSVMLFKNHGPMSGGSIRHPHMQIVGLQNVDYRKHIIPDFFEGIHILSKEGVELSVSTKPKIGFIEFNIITKMGENTKQVVDYLQFTTKFILKGGFFPICESYNLFFYELQENLAVKIVPRYLTSPIYVGYSIPQIWTGLEEMVIEIRKQYNSNRDV